jgi:hypothetical protein
MKKIFVIFSLSFTISAILALLDVFGAFISSIIISAINNSLNERKKILSEFLFPIFSVCGLLFTQMIIFKEFEIITYIIFLVVYFSNRLLYLYRKKVKNKTF